MGHKKAQKVKIEWEDKLETFVPYVPFCG